MTKKHIMVVDDTPANLLLVLRVLKEDYQVSCVESGKECLDRLSEQPVDLILMDMLMPKMNGYECCRHIKQEYHYHLTPVIFLSGQTQLKDKLKGYEAGGADYLTKPCDIHELLNKVEFNLNVVAKSRGESLISTVSPVSVASKQTRFSNSKRPAPIATPLRPCLNCY